MVRSARLPGLPGVAPLPAEAGRWNRGHDLATGAPVNRAARDGETRRHLAAGESVRAVARALRLGYRGSGRVRRDCGERPGRCRVHGRTPGPARRCERCRGSPISAEPVQEKVVVVIRETIRDGEPALDVDTKEDFDRALGSGVGVIAPPPADAESWHPCDEVIETLSVCGPGERLEESADG